MSTTKRQKRENSYSNEILPFNKEKFNSFKANFFLKFFYCLNLIKETDRSFFAGA